MPVTATAGADNARVTAAARNAVRFTGWLQSIGGRSTGLLDLSPIRWRSVEAPIGQKGAHLRTWSRRAAPLPGRAVALPASAGPLRVPVATGGPLTRPRCHRGSDCCPVALLTRVTVTRSTTPLEGPDARGPAPAHPRTAPGRAPEGCRFAPGAGRGEEPAQ